MISSACSTASRVTIRGATLTLYGKPGCHLCDEARGAVERVRLERDVRRSKRWTSRSIRRCIARYGERIPVLALDGEELFELVVDADCLRTAAR